jgi:ABC-type lipoprotein release transport system permease subunit
MIDTGAKMGMGHVTIEPQDYQNKPSLDKRLHNTGEILRQTRALDAVASAVPRIMGQAMFASANKSVGGAFIAINPELEHANNNLFIKSLIEGKKTGLHHHRCAW